ncbi:MAG TPA: glycosyltransferase family 4 protein [Stellaceae bacterium]|jgi:glycosyltransferase involved in cell wall biosynthesis|nr:glycosyltransferase family 4 protein [Stellaceae bacterium]
MRRALLIDPGLNNPGGGTCVAAYALQALRRDFEVTLLTWNPVDFEPVNAAFGTELKSADFRLLRVPDRWRRAQRLTRLPLALLCGSLLQRKARELLRREHFDLVVSTTNEIDVGVRAIQYVHYPWNYYPRPDADYRWYHFGPVLKLYRGMAIAINGGTNEGIARNQTLVNSAWTGRRFEQWYGSATRVLHPPVPIDREPLPWDRRTDTFACVGRMSPEKNIEGVIDILAEVRGSGYPISLLICGQRQVPAYERKILALAGAHPDWISISLDVPRGELIEGMARCRYGIHGMVGEHFGIAVAEMARLGCLCFAPADGGPAEILGNDPALLYASPGDAVEKICRLLADPGARAEARQRLEARAGLFSAERFTAEFREICSEFVASSARAS